jgi:alpha-1,6-mannosyltransferase
VTAPLGQRALRLVQVAAVATTVLWLVGALGGVGSGWVLALGVPAEVRTPLSVTTQLGWLTGVLLTPAGVSVEESVAVARLLGQVAAVTVVGRLALRTATGVPAAAVRSVALGLLVVVVLGPVVHHWYLLWFVPLLAASHLGRRASAALLAAAALPGLVGPLDSSLAGAGTLITLGVSLTVAVALWLGRLHHRGGRPRRQAEVV